MITRYSRKELTNIWSEKNKYKIWLDVEIAAAQAMEKLGQIPKGVSSTVRKKEKINYYYPLDRNESIEIVKLISLSSIEGVVIKVPNT